MSTVAAALARPHNGFGLLRLALALAVVVSHCFSVTTGRVADEPLTGFTGYTLGEHAVNGFFAISGFLVTMSLDRRGARDYALARALRILPGLVAAVLAVSLLLGAALTRLPLDTYWREPGLWRFIAETLTRFRSNGALPGVFSENPFRFPMGTVWTLKYEILCYAGLLAAGLAGALRRRWLAPALVAGLFLGLVVLGLQPAPVPKGVETALRLPLIFSGGAALYLWRDRVRLSWPIALGLLAAALGLRDTALGPPLLFTAETYAAIRLAFAPALSRPGLDPRADLSYGTYLYGWPVQQSLCALVPAAGAWQLLPPALLLTLGVAALSWYAVEKPALGLKHRLLGRRPLPALQGRRGEAVSRVREG